MYEALQAKDEEEMIMYDDEGSVTEGLSSNAFVITDVRYGIVSFDHLMMLTPYFFFRQRVLFTRLPRMWYSQEPSVR